MNKRILIGLLITAVFTYVSILNFVSAKEKNSPQPLEEFLPEIGYKTVEVALKEFEQHYNKELKLPLRVPPISFTHHVGRFSDLEGENNDQLEVVMISEQLPQNHFKIMVRPVQHKMPFKKYITDVFTLKNGSEAVYIENPRIGFHLLVFEREDWQYVFSIDRDVANQVTAKVLIDIANSIDYPKQK